MNNSNNNNIAATQRPNNSLEVIAKKTSIQKRVARGNAKNAVIAKLLTFLFFMESFIFRNYVPLVASKSMPICLDLSGLARFSKKQLGFARLRSPGILNVCHPMIDGIIRSFPNTTYPSLHISLFFPLCLRNLICAKMSNVQHICLCVYVLLLHCKIERITN